MRDMGRHAAPGFEEQAVGPNGQRRVIKSGLAAPDDLVEQDHRRARAAAVRRSDRAAASRSCRLAAKHQRDVAAAEGEGVAEHGGAAAAIARQARVRRRPARSPGSRDRARRPTDAEAGDRRDCSRDAGVSQRNAASQAPAAPSVWPVIALVELHGVPVPNSVGTALPSIASLSGVPVPCRLT